MPPMLVSDPAVALTHTISSEFQRGPNALHVVLPAAVEPGRKYTVIYVLPVAAGPDEDRDTWGWSLTEVLGQGPHRHENLADKYGVIFVFPVFDTIPWYGDHPRNPRVRQESYLLQVVIPFIEKTYPALAAPRGRLLLGFSKSGFGAVSLLLRHPDLFGRAAAWDAPLMLEHPGPFGSSEVFPTPESFAPCAIPPLFEKQAASLRTGSRLILMGYSGFREHMQQADALLTRLGIPHEYRDGPKRDHSWYSGWLPEAVALLMGNDRGQTAFTDYA